MASQKDLIQVLQQKVHVSERERQEELDRAIALSEAALQKEAKASLLKEREKGQGEVAKIRKQVSDEYEKKKQEHKAFYEKRLYMAKAKGEEDRAKIADQARDILDSRHRESVLEREVDKLN